MQGDVFGLNRIYDLQTENITGGLDLSIPGLNYGYYTGAWPGSGCTIDRLDFSTEISNTLSSNLSYGVHDFVAIPSRSYGYFAGGYNGVSSINTISRLDFSNETVSNSTNNLPTIKSGSFSSQNNYYGYVVGDWDGSCTINRIDFSSEVVSNPGNNLTITRAFSGDGSIQNNSYGYFAGGSSGPTLATLISTITRIDFSNETISNPGTNFPQAQSYSASAASNSHGYFGGGYTPTIDLCTINRLTFSNETVTTITPSLREISYGAAATSNSSYGYFGGGRSTGVGSPDFRSNIQRIDFSTESVTLPTANFSINRVHLSGLSINRPGITKISPRFTNWTESATTGYFAGGIGNATISTIDRLDFASETTTVPSTKLSEPKYGVMGLSNSSFGYYIGWSSRVNRFDYSTESMVSPSQVCSYTTVEGGYASTNYYGYAVAGYSISSIYRLDFSTESTTLTSSNLTYNKRYFGSTYNYNYGYFGGGVDSTPSGEIFSNIDRLDFSNETTSNLLNRLPRSYGSNYAAQSSSYGYFGGGNNANPVFYSTIERLDFSTETTFTLGSKLLSSKSAFGTANSNSYGYFGSGWGPTVNYCTIDRLDFTTETTSELSSKVSYNRGAVASLSGGTGTRKVGKATYGYYGGGYSYTSIIERLDFTTETIAPPSINSKLSQTKAAAGAVSNNYYGYFAGGWSPVLSSVDRLDFSSETTVLSPTRISQSYVGSIQSSSYGYFGGSYTPTNFSNSTVTRLDFNTETSSTPTSKLSQGRFFSSGVSNNLYGYFGGGSNYPPALSNIDRLDFSTDTIAAPGTYQLSSNRSGPIAVYNHSYGYFGGGYNISPFVAYCTIDRLDFSTETRATPGTYQLTQARGATMGLSSSSYGYFGGGYVSSPSAPPTGRSSKIDRLDFSAETISVPSQKLTGTKTIISALSNSQ